MPDPMTKEKRAENVVDRLRIIIETASETLQNTISKKDEAFARKARVDAETLYLTNKMKRSEYERVNDYANSVLSLLAQKRIHGVQK